jgi:predicted transcriptional regulator
MPKSRNHARIAITIPEKDLATADRLARKHDRSRSWIVAEAVRRLGASAATGDFQTQAAANTLSAPEPGLGESRHAQLMLDMALTPEERVRAAEETLRLTERGKIHRRQVVIGFETYEDFLDWKRKPDAQR